VRELREARRLSQERLASLSGLDRAALARIERGAHDPSFDELRSLARALELPASALVAAAEMREHQEDP
jgi:transcriptional regulator with XRE-family HTH domain